MARRASAAGLVVPSLRDFGVAVYEISGWAVAQLIGLLDSRWRPTPTGALPALMLAGVLALGVWGALGGGWKALAFWAIPLVIVVVHAIDLARMRVHLASAAREPYPLPPDLTEEASVRSPLLGALHRSAKIIALSFQGRWLDAQELAQGMDRGRLDERSARLLDAARAFADLRAGDRERAAQLAIVSLPTWEPRVDRELAISVLAQAWNDPERLGALAAGWAGPEYPEMMRQLGVLASIRLAVRGGGAPADAVERRDLVALAADAREVGDEELADRLIALSAASGPYR